MEQQINHDDAQEILDTCFTADDYLSSMASGELE
jgi:hypothetical protein